MKVMDFDVTALQVQEDRCAYNKVYVPDCEKFEGSVRYDCKYEIWCYVGIIANQNEL